MVLERVRTPYIKNTNKHFLKFENSYKIQILYFPEHAKSRDDHKKPAKVDHVPNVGAKVLKDWKGCRRHS